ncbi:MAG: B12-binding domain-containing radical SAM protein [Acidobacteria bacterium]|jgi:radical SAM superfamily enzyme YgiQ (UPF0313 family)|nr:B12-binding domain-containing radical SAM protein [Acidobacteriota bacterium]
MNVNINKEKEKILLVLLPFWTPLSPPLGITCLKDFLRSRGFQSKAVDVSAEDELKQYSNQYFSTLNRHIPADKKGNFYSIVNNVLRNHMMAHINYEDVEKYLELVKILISKTFYVDLEKDCLLELVSIIDGFYGRLKTYFLDLLAREKPTVLGLSVYSDTLPASVFCFRLARTMYPDIMTVMGGGVFADLLALGSPNLEFFLEKTQPYIDKIVIGEGEHLFLEVLASKAQDKRVFTLADVNSQLLDLTTVEPPDFSDYNLASYPYLVTYTSRSCPFQCAFCSETVQWGKYRKKSIPQVVRELKGLSQVNGGQLFLLGDSLLNPVINDLSDELLKAEESIYWEGWLRVSPEACDTANTLKWRRAGFYHARLGIESGSPRILELMGKKIQVEQIKQTLFSLSLAGIKTTTLWIVGYPGETEEDFQQTLALIEELKDYIYEAEGTPFWYYLTGQSNSNEWSKKTSELLYPAEAANMLLAQTWILSGEPTRETTYARLNRFTNHLRELRVPNTYSLHEIYKADERWQNMHRNAVPPLVAFTGGHTCIDENKRVQEVSIIEDTGLEDGGFGF